jgi:hypothetical protein
MAVTWMLLAYLAGAATVIIIGIAEISSFFGGLRAFFDALFGWLH